MDRLPFSLPDVGIREVKGFVHLDDEFLSIEVWTAIPGLAPDDTTVINVAPTALTEIRLKPGLIRDRLRLIPEKVELLRTMPGTHRTEVALRIARTHRDAARRLADEMQRRILQQGMAR